MTTTTHPTNAELVAQAHQLRPSFHAPLQWSYECLSTMYDAIEAARAATHERIQSIREDHDPMPAAGERAIARIRATAADPANLDDWRAPEARTTAGRHAAAVERPLPSMRRPEAERIFDAIAADLAGGTR